MATSPEYPDLRWMPPRSWDNANRTSVQLVVIHTTEGSEGPSSAEDGASYDQRRTDGTSTHYFHDSDSTVQCVNTADLAHAARSQGNRRGIQHELCGRAGQGGGGWADPVSQGTLRQAAKQVARDCAKWDIPVRKLSAVQVATGFKGICGHVDVTNAFPQDNGTHTDPGPAFPWDAFLGMVRNELEGNMAITPADLDSIAEAVWNRDLGRSGPKAGVALQAGYGATQALVIMAKAEATEVPPSVQEIVDGVEAAFSAGTPADTAAALKAVLGSKAQEVGRLLAAS